MMSLRADSDLAMDAVAKAVSQGECVLFLGAGIHAPPPPGSEWDGAYPEAQRPELAGALVKRLASAAKWPTGLDLDPDEKAESWQLQRMSMFCEARLKRPGLIEQIRQAVGTGKQPSPIVRALAELNFPVVITTNYDLLFDNALRTAGKTPRIARYDPEPSGSPNVSARPKLDEPFLFKMHGDLEQPSSIVITDEDYIQFVLVASLLSGGSPLPTAYLYWMQTCPTLFLGYSLHDYNLRLLFKMLRWGVDENDIPGAYSVDLKPDPLILDVWQNTNGLITFIAENVWSFVPELYQRVRGSAMPKYDGDTAS